MFPEPPRPVVYTSCLMVGVTRSLGVGALCWRVMLPGEMSGSATYRVKKLLPAPPRPYEILRDIVGVVKEIGEGESAVGWKSDQNDDRLFFFGLGPWLFSTDCADTFYIRPPVDVVFSDLSLLVSWGSWASDEVSLGWTLAGNGFRQKKSSALG